MKNYKSFWGEPTTNLSYNNGQGGSEYLAASFTWTNSGTWTLITDETDVSPPAISYSQYLPKNLRIISGMTLTVGSQHFGCGFTTISPSTQYTFSVWFMQNRAGCSAPYLRTNVNNNSLGNFAYNGNTDSSTWPVNQWIRISCTGTTQANENGLYLSNYIGYSIGDKIWYYGHQLEAKSYPTSLVAGTRSNTQTIVDLMGQNTITATSLTYASNNTFSFDGNNNNYIDGGNNTSILNIVNPTVCVWVKRTSYNSSFPMIIRRNDRDAYSLQVGQSNDTIWFKIYQGSSVWTSTPTSTIPLNTWCHFCGVFTGSQIQLYKNGQLVQTANTSSPISYDGASIPQLIIGRDDPVPGRYWHGDIPSVQLYNRALTSNEVLQNFNAQRGIYGI